MISTQYTVTTPYGSFQALWDEDEDKPVIYAGSEQGMAFFKAFLALKTQTGRNGAILAFDSLEPSDLYGFCQSKEYGIQVLPEFDELIALLAEAEADSDEALPKAILDSIFDTEPKEALLELLRVMRLPETDEAERILLAQRLMEMIPQVVFDTDTEEDEAVAAATTILENLP